MRPSEKTRGAVAALLALGALVQGLLVLELIGRVFHPWLNSDHLYPHAFVRDLLWGEHALAGWKFGTAPFFLPDYLIFAPLVALTGTDGLSYALYALLQSAAYTLALTWLLDELRPAAGRLRCAATSVWSLNLLWLLHPIADHGLGLWWLLLPGFHGGALLAGLLWIAWQLRLTRGEAAPDRQAIALGAVWIALASFSNALFFFHFVLPWTLLLLWRGRRDPAWRARARRTVQMAGAGLGGFLGLKLLLSVSGVFAFARHFRYFPTPAHLAETASALLESLSGPLWALAGGVLLAAAATVGWLLVVRRRGADANRRLLGDWLLLQSAIVVALPLAAGYWKNEVSARYWLPLWLLPVIWVAVWLTGGRWLAERRQAWVWLVAVLITGWMVFAFRWCPERWHFPEDSRVAAVEAVARERGLERGLAQYWNFHFTNELAPSRSSWEVLPVEPDGQPYFWCVNVNAFVAAEDARWPRYDFVIIDGLDPVTIEAVYGPPLERVPAAGWTLWIYGEAAQPRLQAALEPPVRKFLGQSLTAPGRRESAPP